MTWGSTAVHTYPDAERVIVDYLADALADAAETATVAVGVPDGWTPTDPPHVQIAWDGTPSGEHPIFARCTIRVTVHAATTTEAKRLAGVAQGHLLAHPGGAGVATTVQLTGISPLRDPDTRTELATFTVRVTIRSV